MTDISGDNPSSEQQTGGLVRIPSGGLRQLGVVNWVISKLAARQSKTPQMHLFTTLGQHKRLFRTWLPFQLVLVSLGKLSKQDTEFVILRVGHLRDCAYELQQHRRIAERRGLDADMQGRIFEGPTAEGLTERQRALLIATDELIRTRTLRADTWAELSRHLDRPRLIEFVVLASQYDALAATLTALDVTLDFES